MINNASEKTSIAFKTFLKTKTKVKVYFALAIFFALYGTDSFAYFILKLIFMFLFALGLAFFDYKMFSKKTKEGKIIEMLGYELSEKKYPYLFGEAQKNYELIKQKIQKASDIDCGGNTLLAIDLLEHGKGEIK